MRAGSKPDGTTVQPNFMVPADGAEFFYADDGNGRFCP
jgi:hypothetical protein